MNRKGFTLIELLAVIVLLAVLSTIIIGTVSNSVKDAKSKKTDIDNSSIIKACKLYAIEENVEASSEICSSVLVSLGYLESLDTYETYEIIKDNGVISCKKSNSNTAC